MYYNKGVFFLLKKKKSVARIYSFAICWAVCCLLFPIHRLIWFLITIILSCLSAYLIPQLIRSKRGEDIEDEEISQAEEETYDPKVQSIVTEGRTAISEMDRLYNSIENEEVRSQISELKNVTEKIIQDAIDDPSDVPQIKQFMNYYLPTTLKLLNSYDRMDSQGIQGDNLDKSKESIEQMLDTAITAYKKQLDALFADQAMDIETDIQVMNQMLEREGLSESMNINNFVGTQAAAQAEQESAQTEETEN